VIAKDKDEEKRDKYTVFQQPFSAALDSQH
jgi:hypothetical protein